MTTTDRWRLVVGVGLAVVLGWVLAGCGDESEPDDPGPAGAGESSIEDGNIQDGGEPADPRGIEPIPGVDFTATVAISDDEVTITYGLVNGSSTKLYLANRVGRGDAYGRISHDPNFVYATGTPEGGVDLSKRAFATPDTDRKSWAQAPRVGVSVLAPGDRMVETLTVPWPLERHQPWGSDYGYGEVSLPDPVERVRFCLGVLPEPTPAAAAMGKDDQGRAVTHGNATNAAQHVYCSDPVEP